MTKRFLLWPLIFCLHTAAAQTVWSLQACIDYALQNNISVKEADLQKRLTGLALSQAKAARWPSLSFNGNSGYRFGLSENPTTGTLQSANFFNTGLSLSTGVDLFSWFGKRHTVNAATAEADAANSGIQKAQNDVILTVQAAYLQALLAKELVNTSILQVQQSLMLMDAVTKKIAVGAAAEPDRLQLHLQVFTDSAALLTAEENKTKTILQLKAVLALDAASPLEVETLTDSLRNLPIAAAEMVYNNAVAALPEVRGIGHQLRASDYRIKAAKAARLPSLSFFGSAGSNYVNIPSAQSFVYVPQQATGAKVLVNGALYDVVAPSYQVTGFGVTPLFRQLQTNFGQNVGLALSLPIASGKTLATAIKREEIGRQQVVLQKERLLQELKTTIYTAHAEAVAAQSRWHQSKQIAEEAAKLVAAAQKRYGLNLLSTQDLLIQRDKWQRATTDLLVAKYQAVFRMKVLEFYQQPAKQ